MINPEKLLKKSKTFAVIGVNKDPESYANLIVKKLREKHKTVYPVNPNYDHLFNEPVFEDLEKTPSVVDVVVFVVNPTIGINYLQSIHDLGIKVIWLQPGTISIDLLSKAKDLGIKVVEACVLVVSHYI
jgi:predicted CoA-binding protein